MPNLLGGTTSASGVPERCGGWEEWGGEALRAQGDVMVANVELAKRYRFLSALHLKLSKLRKQASLCTLTLLPF